MKFLLFWALLPLSSFAQALEVSLLTPEGPRVLKSWTVDGLKKLSRGGMIPAEGLVFEESTRNLDLNARAEIDLITLHGSDGKVARIPRFMIWKGSLKLRLGQGGKLQSRASEAPPLIPSGFFAVEDIRKIELSRASTLYPGTRLQVRTNPAASRGEKLFTQSCMACHSLRETPKLEATLLNESYLRDFSKNHRPTGGIVLDARALRGLVAYREALASGKISVNSSR